MKVQQSQVKYIFDIFACFSLASLLKLFFCLLVYRLISF